MGPLELQDLSGKAVAPDDFKGKVTVLHFWEYKDSPLEEPYGQVGYLDFLYRKRKAAGVQVFGVAVDPRAADASQLRAATAGAKKLQSFMNLSYPILLDDGSALKKFGDPRPAGAKLPVFVVLDARGKVVLYQVGHFEVNRDRGLEELDAAIGKALAAAK
jgi:peroxiredoxin